MSYFTGSAAPLLAADAFVQGQLRFPISLAEYRGSWVIVAFAARHADVLELSQLEEAFGADGAVILATTTEDWHEAATRYAGGPVRFPILTEVEEERRITLVVDPSGVVRHVDLRRSARETLSSLEAQLLPLALAA